MLNKDIFKPFMIFINVIITVIITSCCYISDPKRSSNTAPYKYGFIDSLPVHTKIVLESNTGRLDTAEYGEIHRDSVIKTWRSPICRPDASEEFKEVQSVNFKNKLWHDSLIIRRLTSYTTYIGYGDDPPPTDEIIKLSLEVDNYKGECSFKGKKQKFLFNGTTISDCVEMHFNGFAKVLYSKNKGILRINYFKSITNDSVFVLKEIIRK
jgi:hypothetical protein